MIRKILNVVGDRWPYVLMFVLAAAITAALFGYKLNSLVQGVSASEIEMSSQIGVRKIIANPIDLPYKVLALGLSKFFSLFTALRLASAVFAAVFIWFFYVILHNWHTRRIAILGTLLFASSTWLLHSARMGVSDITLLSPLAILALGTWEFKTKRFGLILMAGLAAVGLCIYVPGLVWLTLAAIIWQAKRIWSVFKRAKLPHKIISILLLLMLLAPLVFGLTQNPSLIRVWLGLPRVFPDVYSYLRNLIQIPIDLYVKFDGPADIWLSGVPLLDMFGSAMTLLGLYAYFFKLKLDRAKTILGATLLSALLIGLGGVYIAIILPYLHLLLTAGFALMIQQWFTVFPRNPLARGLALSLMIITVSLSIFYQLNRYFIAWPNAPQTKAAFIARPAE